MNHIIELAEGDTVTVSRKAATPPVVPVEPVPVPVPVLVRREVGLNLESNVDWQRSRYFINVMRSARCISGNPKTGPSTWRVLTGTDNVAPDGLTHGSLQPRDFIGVYTLSFVGGGTPSVTGATITSPGRVTVTRVGNVDLSFSAPVSDIRLLRPGYTSDADVFTREFLADIEPFKVLRFMDWMNTNCDELEKRKVLAGLDGKLSWADRPRVEDQTWNGPLGVPLEVCVALCNKGRKDMQFNIPHDSNADWVRGAFAYIKANLDPSLKVYFSFSNEIVFNAIFPQYAWAKVEASAYMAAGTLPSLYPIAQGNDNDQYRMTHFILKLLLDCEAIAREIFGASEMLTRIRPMFDVQFASYGPTVDALFWANKIGLNLRGRVYGLNIAPYYGPGDPSAGDLATKDTCFAAINRQLDARDSWASGGLAFWYSIAAAYGLKLGCYECGLDHGENVVNLDVLNAVAYDPRSVPVTARYLEQLLEVCDAPVCYFQYCTTNSRWGQYGATDRGMLADGSPAAAPKWDALLAAAKANVPPRGGLTWKITRGTITETRVQGACINLQNYWTGGAVYDPGVSQSIEARNFTAAISGKYVPAAGVTALVAEVGPTDAVQFTPPTSFTAGVPVPIALTFSGDFSGNGAAWFRLYEMIGGVKKQVPQSRLIPE